MAGSDQAETELIIRKGDLTCKFITAISLATIYLCAVGYCHMPGIRNTPCEIYHVNGIQIDLQSRRCSRKGTPGATCSQVRDCEPSIRSSEQNPELNIRRQSCNHNISCQS